MIVENIKKIEELFLAKDFITSKELIKNVTEEEQRQLGENNEIIKIVKRLLEEAVEELLVKQTYQRRKTGLKEEIIDILEIIKYLKINKNNQKKYMIEKDLKKLYDYKDNDIANLCKDLVDEDIQKQKVIHDEEKDDYQNEVNIEDYQDLNSKEQNYINIDNKEEELFKNEIQDEEGEINNFKDEKTNIYINDSIKETYISPFKGLNIKNLDIFWNDKTHNITKPPCLEEEDSDSIQEAKQEIPKNYKNKQKNLVNDEYDTDIQDYLLNNTKEFQNLLDMDNSEEIKDFDLLEEEIYDEENEEDRYDNIDDLNNGTDNQVEEQLDDDVILDMDDDNISISVDIESSDDEDLDISEKKEYEDDSYNYDNNDSDYEEQSDLSEPDIDLIIKSQIPWKRPPLRNIKSHEAKKTEFTKQLDDYIDETNPLDPSIRNTIVTPYERELRTFNEKEPLLIPQIQVPRKNRMMDIDLAQKFGLKLLDKDDDPKKASSNRGKLKLANKTPSI